MVRILRRMWHMVTICGRGMRGGFLGLSKYVPVPWTTCGVAWPVKRLLRRRSALNRPGMTRPSERCAMPSCARRGEPGMRKPAEEFSNLIQEELCGAWVILYAKSSVRISA